jgi:hypothetical protein
MSIQPDAKVVQADLGGQACLKASEGMWAFFSQTKRVEQFVKNALNALTQASQPPMPLFGASLR